MVQGSSSFHVPDVHIGPILQQEFTSNQWTLRNKSKETIQHQISRIRAKPVLPSHHWIMRQRKQKGFASISNLNTTRLYNSKQSINGKKIVQKQLWENIVNTTSASHCHSLAKQAVQKEQWHRNIPIIPLPLLSHQSVLCITYPSHCLNEWCCFVFLYVDPVYFSSMGQCFCHIRKILLKGSSIQLQSWTRLFGVIEHRRLLLVSFWKEKKSYLSLIPVFIRYLLEFWSKM